MGSFAVPLAMRSPRTINLKYPENFMVVPGFMVQVTLSGTSKLAERIVSREMFSDSLFAQEEVSMVRMMIMDEEIVFMYPCNLTPVPSPTGRGELWETFQ
jgi:hypothetical protein